MQWAQTRPTQCVGGLYLTVTDSLAPLPINNNNISFSQKSYIFQDCSRNCFAVQITSLNRSVVEWIGRLLLKRNLGSIPGRVKRNAIEINIHSLPAWRSGQCKASPTCGRLVDRWGLDSKTEISLLCILANATWWTKCNYNYFHWGCWIFYIIEAFLDCEKFNKFLSLDQHTLLQTSSRRCRSSENTIGS